jgi:hypothetical protein
MWRVAVFSEQLMDVIIKVVASWQVIAVSIAIILYFLLVSYVGRTYRRRQIAAIVPKLKKKKKTYNAEVTADDDLGLEETSE